MDSEFTSESLASVVVTSIPPLASDVTLGGLGGLGGEAAGATAVTVASRAMQRALEVLEICYQILQFLDLKSITHIEAVSKWWQRAVDRGVWVEIGIGARVHDRIQHVTAVLSRVDATPKKHYLRAWRSTNSAKGRILLTGGCFGSVHRTATLVTCRFQSQQPEAESEADEDALPTVEQHTFRSEAQRIRLSLSGVNDTPMQDTSLGACASTTDSFGNKVLLGGWSDNISVSSSRIFTIDPNTLEKRLLDLRTPLPLCFAASASTRQGDVLYIGGCDHPYQDAVVQNSCFVYRGTAWQECATTYEECFDSDLELEDDIFDSDSEDQQPWTALPNLTMPRCGHGAIALFDERIFVGGGYRGGRDYMRSTEILDFAAGGRWMALPNMHHERSGAGFALDSHQNILVVGGSMNGTLGHRSLERFDVREGSWQLLADMHIPRGYTAACIGNLDCLYVSGGLHGHEFQCSMEVYEPRMNKWSYADPTMTNQTSAIMSDAPNHSPHRRSCHQMFFMWD